MNLKRKKEKKKRLNATPTSLRTSPQGLFEPFIVKLLNDPYIGSDLYDFAVKSSKEILVLRSS